MSLAFPAVPVCPRALRAERQRSPAPGSARRARVLEGGRTSSGKEGKRCTSLASLHHFHSKLRNKGRASASGTDPGREQPRRRGYLGSSRGAWRSWGSFHRCPGGLSRAAGPVPWTGRVWGARLPLARGRNSGPFAHGSAWALESTA